MARGVRPIEASILDEWRSAGRKFQIIPSKLVHTIKARSARAARLVLSVAVTLRLGSISEKGRRMPEESVQPRCVQY